MESKGQWVELEGGGMILEDAPMTEEEEAAMWADVIRILNEDSE
jgi:hypothetical protein